MIFDFITKLTNLSLKKELTIIMTTHNDIIISTLAKLVSDRKLITDDIKVYYFERSREKPWTTLREIKVYSDGTIEGFPDVEEIITKLF